MRIIISQMYLKRPCFLGDDTAFEFVRINPTVCMWTLEVLHCLASSPADAASFSGNRKTGLILPIFRKNRDQLNTSGCDVNQMPYRHGWNP
ncbi:hypothetical protein LXM25_21630 [Dyadobacter sp. LJ53]|uniref:hypothetical protein n=1 Tax=Dyadobacter chenwenxiniae TaxID=2906456 RepID=UPI001F42C7FF|nr:hypothetical protein [Dyadobacter chenwenxiniae]MCF0052688.1 hypothetical protein [Dyadobacter chenwenxiniae]